MSDFIHDDFLLQTPLARRLYHEQATRLPIIDYHSHLDPRELADDRSFANLTDVWIATDPYKHRALRIAGVPERFITGAASAREKFDCWANVVPQTLGNPLFHWSALDLQRCFGIGELLGPDTADGIWNRTGQLLQTPGHSARGLISRANVEILCTSDRLLDDLTPHKRLASSGFPTQVRPSLRADDVLAVETPGYLPWLGQLGRATHVSISCWESFRNAVNLRLDEFDRAGCRLADHALDDFVYAAPNSGEIGKLFVRRLADKPLPVDDCLRFRSALLQFLGQEYARRGWVMQLHLGARRETSTRLRKLVGPAGGYAAIGRTCDVGSLCCFLDELEIEGLLPRTILYTLNPADNAVLATLTGSYTAAGVRGKLQFGAAWWYNDHQAGISRHLDDLASFGLLSTFVGMTTDSRSLLSMPRHEYFRRILCDFLGARVAAGQYPNDKKLLAQLVCDIAYENPRRWIFGERTTTHD